MVAAGKAASDEGLPAGTPDCTLHVTCMSADLLLLFVYTLIVLLSVPLDKLNKR